MRQRSVAGCQQWMVQFMTPCHPGICPLNAILLTCSWLKDLSAYPWLIDWLPLLWIPFSHTHFLIAHVPIWTLSIWHHLPHKYAKAPHVTSWAELAMLKGLRCRPPHRNLAALMERDRQRVSELMSDWNQKKELKLATHTSEAVYVGMLWSRPLMSRDRPKSDTLQTRLELTNTFLAARSRCTKFLSER